MAIQDKDTITVSKSVPEDSVKLKENIIKHKEPILQCIIPSRLLTLVKKLGMEDHEEFLKTSLSVRRKQANLLYDEILKRSAYKDFLCSLEEDIDHMGHKYVISLLKDTQFAPEKETKESEKILENINNHIMIVLQEVDVKTLTSYLREENLVTDDELDEILCPMLTKQNKVKTLLVILKTKGPNAHFIFVHKCLAIDFFHNDVYSLLATTNKKRKLSDPELAMARKKEICFVQLPEGITTERYVKTISQIRHYYQNKDIDSCKAAEKIINKELCSQDNPLEAQIAYMLESCTPLITGNQLEEVLLKVQEAKEKCEEFYSRGCDAQVLEGRCEWVLARMHKLRGEYDKAEAHINRAFTYINHCQPGEDRMLVTFEQACILLLKNDTIKSNSYRLLNIAKNSLLVAKNLADQQDYGTSMVQRCKIHLAQVYLHNCRSDMDTCKNAISNAKHFLLEIENQNRPPTVQYEYLYTWAEIHQIEGNKNLASEYLKQASEINKT